jgi:hypothetical protein
MAHDLPGLPIEILINIVCLIELQPIWLGGKSRRNTCLDLRLTCQELNTKLLRFYGTEFCGRVKVPLTEAGLRRLLVLSKSAMAPHVQSMAIDCDCLHDREETLESWQLTSFQATDWDKVWSYNGVEHNELSFYNDVVDMVKSGRCAAFLVPSLDKLANLEELHFLQPTVLSRVTLRNGYELQSR